MLSKNKACPHHEKAQERSLGICKNMLTVERAVCRLTATTVILCNTFPGKKRGSEVLPFILTLLALTWVVLYHMFLDQVIYWIPGENGITSTRMLQFK